MKKLSGWLIVNRFLNNSKFSDIAARFLDSAARFDAELIPLTNADILPALGGNGEGGVFPCGKPDFVLFYDKDVRLASALEARGMRLFNSSRAIELCDDKSLMHLALDGLLPMPRTYCAPFTYENIGYNDRAFVDVMFEQLGSPLVVKEACGSFGQQVYLIGSPEEANALLTSIGGKRVIFQEFVAESFGRDLRLNVVGGRVVASMLRFNEHGDFRANISNGGSMLPHAPTAEEERIALAAAEKLSLDFCGVDLLFGRDGPLLCEVNSNAHFKSIYDCTGVNAADEIMAHIVRTVG